MRSSKLRLQVVGQVKIIDGKDYCRKRMGRLPELFSKSGDLQEKFQKLDLGSGNQEEEI